jgi:FMN phosphatase YigB (HAD superfamily)
LTSAAHWGRNPTTGKFQSFPSSAGLLKARRESSACGSALARPSDLTNADGLALLQEAGLASFLDPQGFISDHDAGVAKPYVEIYHVAAQHVGVPIGRCLYVGENLIEVLGGLAAGMKAILKPCPPGRQVSGSTARSPTPTGTGTP